MSSPSVPASRKQLRSIVTEEALQVSPALLGLPLASPWRRAAAITLDAMLVALLSNTPSVLLGIAAAYVLFRASARRPAGTGYIRRSFRFMMRSGAAVFLFVVVLNLWDSVGDRIRRDDDGGPVRASLAPEAGGEETEALQLTGMQAALFAGEVVALHRADDEAEARRAAEQLLDRMRTSGMTGESARESVRELAGEGEEKPWLAAVVGEVLVADAEAERTAQGAPSTDGERARADSVVAAYSAALAAGDTASADSLRPALVAAVAADTVRALDARYEALDGERDGLREAVRALEERQEEGPGIVAAIRGLMEDLGLGLGWTSLYFTATTAMWQGRTPGKRLLGIRVIRLTGKPIGWWAAFERFGGYAAGFATGLLGFLQIFWDDNRQAIHDKIAVTAVIRDPAGEPARGSGPEA